MTDHQIQRPLEALLREVIEAQVHGKFDKYKSTLYSHWEWSIPPDAATLYLERIDEGFAAKVDEDDYIGDYVSIPILEILLDTEGCKAAYGEFEYVGDEDWKTTIWKECATYIGVPQRWGMCAMNILNSWNSGEGNNVRAALETAVSFLPKA